MKTLKSFPVSILSTLPGITTDPTAKYNPANKRGSSVQPPVVPYEPGPYDDQTF